MPKSFLQVSIIYVGIFKINIVLKSNKEIEISATQPCGGSLACLNLYPSAGRAFWPFSKVKPHRQMVPNDGLSNSNNQFPEKYLLMANTNV